MGNVAVRVIVSASLLAWARDRSGRSGDLLARRFPRLADWESGAAAPTLKQLEAYAAATRTPVGYFFLDQPPEISLPLPDLRTWGEDGAREPSPDLLDTLFGAQRRQQWYRDYARASDAGPLDLVGSLPAGTDVAAAAARIRAALGAVFGPVPAPEPGAEPGAGERRGTWAGSFRRISDQAEELGILVMVSGVAGSNTRRRLSTAEFGGFALADKYAPAVFVNGASSKAAQIFTLVHELVHIWLGQSALDRPDPGDIERRAGAEAEHWCGEIAAEILFPLSDFAREYRDAAELPGELDRLARRYRVSTLLVLRRIYDAGLIDSEHYWPAYTAELARARPFAGRPSRGGNFYYAQPARTSKRFARAIITSTLEGQTLYRDALALLGFRKVSALDELAGRLGVA